MDTGQQTPTRKTHLKGMDDHAAETAGVYVSQMVESPGWQEFLDSIDLFVAEQQRLMMGGDPQEVAFYERHFGAMNALRLLPALAQGVIEHGREARERTANVA